MAKILVVDDDPDILSVIEILLVSHGFEVSATSKGDEVISKLNSFNPDLLLMDVLLSGQDGRNICKKIKKELSFKHLPIIMISAHPAAAGAIEEYGADEFISKPFDIKNLIDKINMYLEKYHL